MNRSSLVHLIRAAANITGDHEIVIIGSQAIHGSLTQLPDSAQRSVEADLYPRNSPEKWDLLDGLLGEDSQFHQTYKYYAQGVSPNTAVLPYDWEARAVSIPVDLANGIHGICVGLEDLVLSKYAASREKDLIYVADVISIGAVEKSLLLTLLEKLPTERCDPNRIRMQIERDFNNAELTKLKGKIDRSETFAINAISRSDSVLAFDLTELRGQPGFPIETLMFEEAESNLGETTKKVISQMGRGDLLHINELKKHWEKFKSLSPNIHCHVDKLFSDSRIQADSPLPGSESKEILQSDIINKNSKQDDFQP